MHKASPREFTEHETLPGVAGRVGRALLLQCLVQRANGRGLCAQRIDAADVDNPAPLRLWPASGRALALWFSGQMVAILPFLFCTQGGCLPCVLGCGRVSLPPARPCLFRWSCSKAHARAARCIHLSFPLLSCSPAPHYGLFRRRFPRSDDLFLSFGCRNKILFT